MNTVKIVPAEAPLFIQEIYIHKDNEDYHFIFPEEFLDTDYASRNGNLSFCIDVIKEATPTHKIQYPNKVVYEIHDYDSFIKKFAEYLI